MVKSVAKILSISVGLYALAGCSSSTDLTQSSLSVTASASLPTSTGIQSQCMGAFSLSASDSFTAGAPEVASDGSGLSIRLTIVDPRECLPLEGIEIDLWHIGTGDTYSSAWRSKQYSEANGVVKYETVVPSQGDGVRHVHVRGVYNGALYWWVVMLDEPVSKDPINLDVTLVLASVMAPTTTTVPSGVNY